MSLVAAPGLTQAITLPGDLLEGHANTSDATRVDHPAKPEA